MEEGQEEKWISRRRSARLLGWLTGCLDDELGVLVFECNLDVLNENPIE